MTLIWKKAAPVLDSPLFMFCGSIIRVAPAICVMNVFHLKKQKTKKALFNEQDFHLQNIYDDFDLEKSCSGT